MVSGGQICHPNPLDHPYHRKHATTEQEHSTETKTKEAGIDTTTTETAKELQETYTQTKQGRYNYRQEQLLRLLQCNQAATRQN
jgi:hypothetical protein